MNELLLESDELTEYNRAVLRGSQNTISPLPGEKQRAHSRSFGNSHYAAWMVRLMPSMMEEAWGFGGSEQPCVVNREKAKLNP